jgi:transcriptional regulator with XRE-family HTH domain
MNYPKQDKTIAARCRRLRGEAPLAEIADRIGVSSPQTWLNWERGESLPTGLAIPALATALGLPVEELRALIQTERDARAAAKVQPEPVGVAS